MLRLCKPLGPDRLPFSQTLMALAKNPAAAGLQLSQGCAQLLAAWRQEVQG